jgi:DNA phosphorothioation system restriction enzyme
MDTSRNDLVRDFFGPLLKACTRYDRGVGYFTSGWIRANSQGLLEFAKNGGHARWITSPILDERDVDALLAGHEAHANPLLKEKMRATVVDLARALDETTLEALSWMVADGILEFRIAIPRNKLTGDFHDKFGVFSDGGGRQVAFNGSYNDSIQGLRNYESIKIFSWERAGDQEIIDAEAGRFERLWWNQDENVRVISLPESVKEDVIRLRKGERPYRQPPPIDTSRGVPRIPKDLELRPYQRQAIKNWFEANGHGIFKMATGTGKTVTALGSVVKMSEVMLKAGKSLAIIIVCPFQHLVTQWETEVRHFGFRPILCYESRSTWLSESNQAITEVNGTSGAVRVLIATNATFCGESFQRLLEAFSSPVMLIADEVHNLGASSSVDKLPPNADYRLGLSATPERWQDEEGTTALSAYFGEVVFEFGLAEAIREGALTPYNYYPVIIDLELDELHQYMELTRKIAEASVRSKKSSADDDALKFLLLRRARLLASARNKLPALRSLLSSQELRSSTHNLIYCGDGRVESSTDESEEKQINAISRMVGRELGWKASTYVAETPNDVRSQLLRDFASGRLRALIAIRCLDEGVDVRETRRAFILASSANPRQFVQRRGRVLRRSEGKDFSEIWDFIVVPPSRALDAAGFNVERKLVERELSRVSEFANLARNGPQASRALLKLKQDYNLRNL